MSHIEQFWKNFIAAAHQVMAESEFNQSEFADWLGVDRVTVYKITQRKQKPTTEQGITLCVKAGIDANWLFLNRGKLALTKKLTPQRKSHAL